MSELRRLIVRHRHVAPMVSALLAGMDASVTIRDAEGDVILDRTAGGSERGERHPIEVERDVLGTVEGGRAARAVAAVLAYAAARERDKRNLASEALERYRELSLIYDLAAAIGAAPDESAIVATAARELARLPGDPTAFVLLTEGRSLRAATVGAIDSAMLGDGIVGGCAARGEADLVEDVADEPLAAAHERSHRAIVVAPLRADGQTIGVIGAASATPAAFRAADLKIVTAIGALTGPAIAQARRHAASLAHRTGRDEPAHR